MQGAWIETLSPVFHDRLTTVALRVSAWSRCQVMSQKDGAMLLYLCQMSVTFDNLQDIDESKSKPFLYHELEMQMCV